MTAAHSVASRTPNRTGVCGAGRSAPSQCEMVTGPGFLSPNQPDQERTTAYRDSPGPDSRSDDPCATIIGDWEEPSGESRTRSARPKKTMPCCPFNLSHTASQRDPGSASLISFCLPTGPRIPLEVDHGQAFTILFRPNTVQGHADAASVHIGAKRLCSKHGRWSGRETLVPVM